MHYTSHYAIETVFHLLLGGKGLIWEHVQKKTNLSIGTRSVHKLLLKVSFEMLESFSVHRPFLRTPLGMGRPLCIAFVQFHCYK